MCLKLVLLSGQKCQRAPQSDYLRLWSHCVPRKVGQEGWGHGSVTDQLLLLPALPLATAVLQVCSCSRISCGERYHHWHGPWTPGAHGCAPQHRGVTLGGAQGGRASEGRETSVQELCEGNNNLFLFSWIKSCKSPARAAGGLACCRAGESPGATVPPPFGAPGPPGQVAPVPAGAEVLCLLPWAEGPATVSTSCHRSPDAGLALPGWAQVGSGCKTQGRGFNIDCCWWVVWKWQFSFFCQPRLSVFLCLY